MNLNMVTSQLRILGNSIRHLEIENDLEILTDQTEKSFGMDIDLLQCEKEENIYFGSIILTVELQLKEEEKAASIKMDVTGDFCADADTIDENEFRKLLLINGAAALYSIARGKIESISALTFEEGRLTLPFVNIVDFYRDKFKAN